MNLREKMRARMPKAGAGRWYEIKAEGNRAVVRVYSEIGFWGVTAEDFANEISQLTATEIEVQINSPGGDVFDGIAIYNALRAHSARIVTRVDGIAASAASVIAQAGDHRVMMTGGQMMVHEAWGMAIGPAAEMREFADLLDRQNDVMVGIYTERTGVDADTVRALLAAETWMTDQEAVDAKFADAVFLPPRQEDPNARSGAALGQLAEQATEGNITLPGLSALAEAMASLAPHSSLTDDDIRALIAAELASLGVEPRASEKPTADDSAGINHQAAQDLLAAFALQGGTPNE